MLQSSASFDRSRRFRYTLWRQWDTERPRCAFCMLNPSTADHRRNDPTISRCLAFARDWGFGALEAVNLFALRATNPRALLDAPDPVGPRNDLAIRRAAARADLFIIAWGNQGRLHDRADHVLDLLESTCSTHHLGLTLQGQPRHPLYLPASTTPSPSMGAPT